jgi:hypothetical protein
MPAAPKKSATSTVPALQAAFNDQAGRNLLHRVSTSLIPGMAGVNAGRRRAIRSSQLLAGKRAVSAPDAKLVSKAIADWGESLATIVEFFAKLTPELIRQADSLIAQVNDPTLPTAELLQLISTVGMGFSAAEFEWLRDQLERAAFEPLWLLSAGEPRVLRSLCHAAIGGDNGLMQVGFIDLGNDADINRDVTEALIRARSSGVTLSIFLLLPALVLAAVEVETDASAHVIRAVSSIDARYALFRGLPDSTD